MLNLSVVSRKWYSQDEAFFNVAEGIRLAVESITLEAENVTKRNLKRIQDLIKEGRTPYDNRRYVDALPIFDRVLFLDENNAEALRYRGDIHRLVTRYKEALADLNRSLELDPNDAFALQSRDKALKRDPN